MELLNWQSSAGSPCASWHDSLTRCPRQDAHPLPITTLYMASPIAIDTVLPSQYASSPPTIGFAINANPTGTSSARPRALPRAPRGRIAWTCAYLRASTGRSEGDTMVEPLRDFAQ